jgi:hypothetical protein
MGDIARLAASETRVILSNTVDKFTATGVRKYFQIFKNIKS